MFLSAALADAGLTRRGPAACGGAGRRPKEGLRLGIIGKAIRAAPSRLPALRLRAGGPYLRGPGLAGWSGSAEGSAGWRKAIPNFGKQGEARGSNRDCPGLVFSGAKS